MGPGSPGDFAHGASTEQPERAPIRRRAPTRRPRAPRVLRAGRPRATRQAERGADGDRRRPSDSDWRSARAYARAQRRAQRAYWRQQRWGGDASTAGLVFGVILVIVGGVFLLQQTMPGFDSALIWPIGLIVLGALLLAGAFRR